MVTSLNLLFTYEVGYNYLRERYDENIIFYHMSTRTCVWRKSRETVPWVKAKDNWKIVKLSAIGGYSFVQFGKNKLMTNGIVMHLTTLKRIKHILNKFSSVKNSKGNSQQFSVRQEILNRIKHIFHKFLFVNEHWTLNQINYIPNQIPFVKWTINRIIYIELSGTTFSPLKFVQKCRYSYDRK